MSALPQAEHTTAGAILQWWEHTQDSGHRPHLGASLIGHPCERHLWLTFRWAKAHRWDGRMLRLFDDGKRAEARFVTELRAIGCDVWECDEAGDQFRVSAHGGHFGGSVDAVASGVPEAPKTPHLAEFKTSNDKLFKVLERDGVRKAKPQHYAQMQAYMGLLDLTRALYLVENKNDASVYAERVEFDREEFARIIERAGRIIAAAEPPPRISDDAAWHECKWCNHYALCHGQAVPEVNCRTCAHATPLLDGTGGAWRCDHLEVGIGTDAQRAGCASHRYIPILLRGIGDAIDTAAEPDGNMAVTYSAPDGRAFVNGAAPGFSSAEIAAAKAPSMLTDAAVQAVKEEFTGALMLSSEPRLEDIPNDIDTAPVKTERHAEKTQRKRVAQTLDQMERLL